MTRHAFPHARGLALLAVGFAAFVVYGSLVPFQYRPLAFEMALSRFGAVLTGPLWGGSYSDWVTNLILLMPLGFLLTGAVAVDRPRSAAVVAAIASTLVCAILAVSVEFAQLWFPPRVTSLGDMVALTLGAAYGSAAWVMFGQRFTLQARHAFAALADQGNGALLLPGYLLYLLVTQTLPFDLTISPGELWHKIQAGGLRPVPFADVLPFGEFAQRQLGNVVLFLPVGILAARSALTRDPARTWGLGLLVAGGLEAVQLFVASRSCDATDVVFGTLAVPLGAAATRQLTADRPGWGWICLAVWVGVLAILNWQPFDFRFDPAWIASRFRAMPLPFADYQATAIIHALDQFLSKMVAFAPLGALLALRFRWGGWAVVAAALIALGLEAGQLFLPTRYPSPTDVILETAGAALGVWLVMRAGRPTVPVTSTRRIVVEDDAWLRGLAMALRAGESGKM